MTNPGSGETLAALTVVVALLVTAVVYAWLRFRAAARSARHHVREGAAETALLSSALQDAFSTLKAREQAMTLRAAASERLSAQVFDSLTAGLIVVDRDGRVQTANPAACRMLARSSDPEGSAYREWIGSGPVGDAIADALSSRETIERRVVHAAERDVSRHFSVTVSPLGAGDPSPRAGVICLFSDVTVLVELEQQLHMKEALARVGEMTAGIAHEFRNGLATIHGYSRLIDVQALPAAYRTYVDGIRQETDALGRVVTNFLNFARPEQVSLLPVDLESLVRRAVEDLRVELPAEAKVDVRGAFGSIEGDEVLLRQLFGNLVRNAAEACTLAGVEPAITIACRLDEARSAAVVTVEDNGPGIPVTDRTRVFQPFFTTRSRGSGLGLAIVLKVVLLHNGTVSVGSAPAGGAQIRMVFPMRVVARAEHRRAV